MIAQQRIFRFTLIPFSALALGAALIFLIAGTATPAVAAGTPDWQQTPGNSPMTHTMPMRATTPPLADHSMHQGQGMMGEGQGMMGDMPMHQAGMADKMVTMGRHMQMMGTMMQMMGQMHGMMEGMMQGGMMQGGMMQGGMMQDTMPMTGTMPMTSTMPMSKGMGMMGGGMMTMPMTEMHAMHDMMDQMMDQMMAEMQELHRMHQGMGAGHAAMDHAKPLTQTVPLTQTGPLPAADSPQRAQVGAVEIIVAALNLQAAEAGTIDFAIAFNSHTEAIAIDLAKQAKLQIGAVELTPMAWETDSPAGHHIKGVLRFAPTAESQEALTAATAITLVISGLPDAAEETFTWEVTAD